MAESKFSEETKCISSDEHLASDCDPTLIAEQHTLKNEGEIRFEGLPYGIACGIYEKFKYAQAAIFEECSDISQKFSTRRVAPLFPLRSWEVLIEGNTVQLRVWDRNRNIFIIKDFPSMRCVVSSTLKITGPITEEMFIFIATRIKGVSKFVYDSAVISPYYSEIRKMYKLKKHSLDISAIENKFSKDFADIEEEISLLNARSVPLAAYFTLRTQKVAKFTDSGIACKDLLLEIQKWKNGKQWASPEIVIENIHNFDFFNFFEEMCKKSPVEAPVPYLQWTLLREKSNIYPVLVVQMYTIKRCITTKQCKKTYLPKW